MSVYDNKIATQRTPAEQDEATATGTSRSLWGWLTIVGIGLCFTPVALLGVGMAVSFGLLWLCAPVVDQVEQECIEETRENGDGLGKFIKTVAMMLCFGAVAIVLALLVMVAMIGGA